MISIYTTKNNLEAICLDEKKQAWLAMIYKLKQVHINEDVFTNIVDSEDNLFQILDQMQVDIISSEKDYINKIPSDPTIVLQHPSGIFLLEISEDKAQEITKDYGVICQSVSLMNHYPLTQPHFPTELIEGETKTWNDIISRFKELPSNSILVIDAHLFDNDKYDEKAAHYDNKYRNGLDNLRDILSCLLPLSYNDVFHIAVLVTDIDEARIGKRSRSNLTNNQIASAINKLKREFNRNYPITIEVLFFNYKDNDGHKLIHNRRILSNYFIIEAPYQLATLNNNKCCCEQSIAAYPLFENIERDEDSDKKEKRIRNDLKQFKKFIKRQENSKSQTATLYHNGKKENSVLNLENRLLIK